MWGGLLGLLWRCRQPVLAGITATVVVAILAAGLTTDLRAYHDAAADGRATLLAVDRLPKATRMRGPLVLDPLPNRNGVAMFVEGYDISAALALRYHTGRREPRARVRAAW